MMGRAALRSGSSALCALILVACARVGSQAPAGSPTPARPEPVYAHQGASHALCPDVVAHPEGYALVWIELGPDATTGVWLALLDSAGVARATPRRLSGTDLVSKCPRILLADDELGVFWVRSPYKIVHTALALDGQQRLPPHEEQAGGGSEVLELGWDGTGYGLALVGSDGTPAFHLYDRDFAPGRFISLSSTTSMWQKHLCAAEGRYLVTHEKDDLIEVAALASDGSTTATTSLTQGGDVRGLICDGPRALLVTETLVGLWRRQNAYQLDAETLELLDGPLVMAELASESVTVSGVTSAGGWLLAFETRDPIGATQIQIASLAPRQGFGITDAGIDGDALLPRFDSSLPSGLEIRAFGAGHNPRLTATPQPRPLLVFTDDETQPHRLAAHFVH